MIAHADGHRTCTINNASHKATCACVVHAAECVAGEWFKGGGTVGTHVHAMRAAGGMHNSSLEAKAAVGSVCIVRAAAGVGSGQWAVGSGQWAVWKWR